MTALACGMIAVGSCNGDVTSTIVQTIMEKSETELKDTYARWLPLGLGLNHLGEAHFTDACGGIVIIICDVQEVRCVQGLFIVILQHVLRN